MAGYETLEQREARRLRRAKKKPPSSHRATTAERESSRKRMQIYRAKVKAQDLVRQLRPFLNDEDRKDVSARAQAERHRLYCALFDERRLGFGHRIIRKMMGSPNVMSEFVTKVDVHEIDLRVAEFEIAAMRDLVRPQDGGNWGKPARAREGAEALADLGTSVGPPSVGPPSVGPPSVGPSVGGRAEQRVGEDRRNPLPQPRAEVSSLADFRAVQTGRGRCVYASEDRSEPAPRRAAGPAKTVAEGSAEAGPEIIPTKPQCVGGAERARRMEQVGDRRNPFPQAAGVSALADFGTSRVEQVGNQYIYTSADRPEPVPRQTTGLARTFAEGNAGAGPRLLSPAARGRAERAGRVEQVGNHYIYPRPAPRHAAGPAKTFAEGSAEAGPQILSPAPRGRAGVAERAGRVEQVGNHYIYMSADRLVPAPCQTAGPAKTFAEGSAEAGPRFLYPAPRGRASVAKRAGRVEQVNQYIYTSLDRPEPVPRHVAGPAKTFAEGSAEARPKIIPTGQAGRDISAPAKGNRRHWLLTCVAELPKAERIVVDALLGMDRGDAPPG